MNIKEEIIDVVRIMAKDIEFRPSEKIENYIAYLIEKSIFEDFSGLNMDNEATIESLYKVAEFNFIRATIITVELPQLHIKMAYSAYTRIFEKYVDELAYEVLADMEKITILLFGLKHFSIRNDIRKLLDAKGKSGYVNILLVKNGYIDKAIDE
jgi:hypothetical protein